MADFLNATNLFAFLIDTKLINECFQQSNLVDGALIYSREKVAKDGFNRHFLQHLQVALVVLELG